MFLALILLLAMVTSQQATYGDESYALYFDNSLSSQALEGSETAKQFLDNLIDRRSNAGIYFDNDSKYILDRDFNVNVLDGTFTNGSLSFSEIHQKLSSSQVENFYILSDYQAYGFEELDKLIGDTTLNYNLLFLRELNGLSNVSVDSLYVNPNPNDLSKLSIVVDFKVHNMSEGNVVIKLLRESSQVSSVVKEVSELNQVEFDVSIEEHGAYEILISGDQVAFDNSFYFVISKRSKPKIVILEQGEIGYITSAFSNEELFNVYTQGISNIDYELLNKADLVVYNNLDDLPVGLTKQFSEPNYIIFPSPNNELEEYSQLTGLSFRQADNNPVEISEEMDHPLLRGIFERSIDESVLPEVPISFSISGEFERIINFRNGQPFLLRHENLFLFNTALTENGGFQSKALFVPILYQIAFASSNRVDVPYLFPGDHFVIDDLALSDDPLRIINTSFELIPSFNSTSNRIIIEIPKDVQAGKYFVVHRSDTLRQIAINVPKVESIMRSPSLDDLIEFSSGRQNVSVGEVSQNVNTLMATNTGVSLWKYALILALLLVLSETMLHRYLK